MILDCVMPAAGASARMGSWKPLLPFKTSTIVETTVEAALSVSARGLSLRVLLVVGERGGEIAELFQDEERVEIVSNPGWRKGMLGSIQKALPLVSSRRFFTIPADMPAVTASIYEALDANWREGEDKSLFPAYEAEAGHPVLISASLLPAMLALAPGGKLRPFLVAAGSRILECGDPSVLADIDFPEDLAKVAALR